VAVLIVAVSVLLICLLVLADRAVKVVRRGLRRREANERLAAAAAKAEEKVQRREAAEEVGGALTSVIPTIRDLDTRHVE
jgi:hypothetical protein